MKTIVFLDRLSGVDQILGTWDDATDPLPVVNAQPFIAADGREVPFASLVKVSPRVAYYAEPMTPASYSFDAAQR